jgi:uncharacterized membrane protein
MIPKTTLNLFKNNFPINFVEIIYLFLTYKSKSIIFSSFKLISIVFFFFISIDSNSQSCNAKLEVHKNRYTKSIPPSGTTYSFSITNTGTSTTNYSLSASNINNNCSNNDGSSSSSNVDLNFSFLDADYNAINSISISSGESINFMVQVKIPSGTPVRKWNCTQINAIATECPSYKLTTVLHSIVSDPTGE